MMRAQREKENDGDWHADKPQQHGTHVAVLSSLFLQQKSTEARMVPPAL